MTFACHVIWPYDLHFLSRRQSHLYQVMYRLYQFHVPFSCLPNLATSWAATTLCVCVAQELAREEVSSLVMAMELPHSTRQVVAQGAVVVDILLPQHQVRTCCWICLGDGRRHLPWAWHRSMPHDGAGAAAAAGLPSATSCHCYVTASNMSAPPLMPANALHGGRWRCSWTGRRSSLATRRTCRWATRCWSGACCCPPTGRCAAASSFQTNNNNCFTVAMLKSAASRMQWPVAVVARPAALPGPSSVAESINTLVTQVLSVPFYAWQAAAAPPQRRTYLEHLLSLNASCLAFDQAIGLAPLRAAQHWQGGDRPQLPPAAAPGPGWDAGASQDFRQVRHCTPPFHN